VHLLLIGFILGLDNLAVAMALGSLGTKDRQWRILLMFAVLAFIFPMLGIWGGSFFSRQMEAEITWLGALLLGALGFWTIYEGFKDGSEQEDMAQRATSWKGLLMIGFGASVDKLVVGFSLGLRNEPALLVGLTVMSAVTAMTYLGLRIGRKANRHWERWATVGAGILLVGLGIGTGLNWI
jgi:manganese efflux pump family protein